MRGRHTERLPCKGSWMRRKAQTEGCIAGWRRKYPAGSGRAFARPGAAPLRRLRRHLPLQGRLLGCAAARCSRFCGPCALCCRAGVHARRGGVRRRGHSRLMQKRHPAKPMNPQGPGGGRDRPPYIATKNGQRPVNSSRLQRPTAGRCKHRPLRRGGRRPGEPTARKGICRAGCGTPPSPAVTPPLAGEAFEGAAHRKAPLQGELDAPEGAD